MRPTTFVAAALLTQLTACITSPPLNLTPSPYTAVVRISLVSESRIGEKDISHAKDAYVIFRDKSKDKIFSFPIRESQIRAQLGAGSYQIVGIELEGGTGNYSPNTRYEYWSKHHEARIELTVSKEDLGKEVEFGSYNPETKYITGDRLRVME